MNIIKKVTVFVMGLVVIGVASTLIGVLTKNVEKSVTFELLGNNDLAFDVYSEIEKYAVHDNNNDVNNLVSATVNNVDVFTELRVYYSDGDYIIVDDGDNNPKINIQSDNLYHTNGLIVGDIITVTFDVEVKTPVFVKTLLLLMPLILTASLIGYLTIKVGGKE